MPIYLSLVQIGQWRHVVDGLTTPPSRFYELLEVRLQERNIPGLRFSRTAHAEGGAFSPARGVLKVQAREFIHEISATLYGGAFQVAWALDRAVPIWPGILEIFPVIGWLLLFLFAPNTAQKQHLDQTYLELVHRTVLDVLDELMSAERIPLLSASERQPVMSELY